MFFPSHVQGTDECLEEAMDQISLDLEVFQPNTQKRTAIEINSN